MTECGVRLKEGPRLGQLVTSSMWVGPNTAWKVGNAKGRQECDSSAPSTAERPCEGEFSNEVAGGVIARVPRVASSAKVGRAGLEKTKGWRQTCCGAKD